MAAAYLLRRNRTKAYLAALHDDLSQNVRRSVVAISRLKRKLPAQEKTSPLNSIILAGITNDLTTQIRRISHQLHQVLEHLDCGGPESQSQNSGRGQNRREFNVPDEKRKIPLDVSVCLYRVALEALRNISRHSNATSARVSLTETCDS